MRDAHACFETGAATDVGRVRALNEDAYVARADRGLWAVADGMGGHEGGEFASAVIADALGRTTVSRSLADLVQDVAALVGEANRRIYAFAHAKGATVGATVAILLAQGREFACLWAGDSRIYQIRDGRIRQATRDHTEAQELIEKGVLSAEQARTWPRRNVITRAVGVVDDPELELARGQLGPADIFVLCSDGLTAHVRDNEILSCALAHPPQMAAQALVELTLTRGAQDNVTVIVVRCLQGGATLGLLQASERATIARAIETTTREDVAAGPAAGAPNEDPWRG